MRFHEIEVGRDMLRVAGVDFFIAVVVVVFALRLQSPWAVIGGVCAGILATLALCYLVVGTRTIREAQSEGETP